MQKANVCYLVRKRDGHTEVCLVEKKRRYGKGLLVGYGGKIEWYDYHSFHSVIREIGEESGVVVQQADLRRIAILSSYSLCESARWSVDVFTCDKWIGNLQETEECGPPEWHRIDQLPLRRMFPDAASWLPHALYSTKLEHISVFYGHDGTELQAVFIAGLYDQRTSKSRLY